MDKDINALNEKLEEKAALVEQLNAAVAELNNKVERMDKNASVMKYRVEQMEEKHSDIHKDMIQATGTLDKMAVSQRGISLGILYLIVLNPAQID